MFLAHVMRRFSYNWLKLRAWELTDFDAVLLLDSDMTVVRHASFLCTTRARPGLCSHLVFQSKSLGCPLTHGCALRAVGASLVDDWHREAEQAITCAC